MLLILHAVFSWLKMVRMYKMFKTEISVCICVYAHPSSHPLFCPISDDKTDVLNPMGTVEKNPNIDSAAGLLISFPNVRPYPLYYPPLDKVPLNSPLLSNSNSYILLNSCS